MANGEKTSMWISIVTALANLASMILGKGKGNKKS